MKKRIMAILLISCVFSFFISAGELRAAPYYEGKVLKIIVSFPPGGGYDRIGRILAKYLPKYIPGKPTVIVENMPGASGMIGANYLYNIAKPDGLTIGTINRAIPSAQLLKIEGVKFDMLKYSWVGSAAVEASVLVLRTDLPYKTYEEMKKVKEPINVGATGPGDLTYNFETLLKQYLGAQSENRFRIHRNLGYHTGNRAERGGWPGNRVQLHPAAHSKRPGSSRHSHKGLQTRD